MTNAKSSSPQIPVSAAAGVSVVIRVRILQGSQLAAATVSSISSIRHDCEPTSIAIIPVGPPNLTIGLTPPRHESHQALNARVLILNLLTSDAPLKLFQRTPLLLLGIDKQRGQTCTVTNAS